MMTTCLQYYLQQWNALTHADKWKQMSAFWINTVKPARITHGFPDGYVIYNNNYMLHTEHKEVLLSHCESIRYMYIRNRVHFALPFGMQYGNLREHSWKQFLGRQIIEACLYIAIDSVQGII